MADKSPNKPSAKKPGMTPEEKRAAKKLKHGAASSELAASLRPTKAGG